jgi:hypothetical protein
VQTSPQQQIRSYLEDSGGAVSVPFHNLLTSWKIDDPSAGDKERIASSLAQQGVMADRPLAELRGDDSVTLALVPPWNGTTMGAQAPQHGGRRRWPRVLAALGVVLAIAGAGVGSFFYGRETRLSDGEVEAKLTRQAAYDKRVYGERQRSALRQQKRSLTDRFERRQTQAVGAAAAAGEQRGYSSGQAVGYGSGKAQGEQEGRSEGEAEGYSEGFDEGLCTVPGTFETIC